MPHQIAIYYNATERHAYGGEDRNDVDLFRDLLTPLIPDTEFIGFDPVHDHFPDDPTIYHGAILGGSAAMVADPEPWIPKLFDQIRQMDEAQTKLFGVCFGHQAIAAALGGKVEERPISLGAPHVEVLSPQKWMHPYMPSLRLFAGNLQQVVEVPKSMQRIAIGRGNPNAMLIKDNHIASLQFHPEFPNMYMEGYVDECLTKRLIDARQHHQAKTEIHGGSDAITMAKWMAHFFKN